MVSGGCVPTATQARSTVTVVHETALRGALENLSSVLTAKDCSHFFRDSVTYAVLSSVQQHVPSCHRSGGHLYTCALFAALLKRRRKEKGERERERERERETECDALTKCSKSS